MKTTYSRGELAAMLVDLESELGGPFGAVNSRNFGRPGLVEYRNPILAEAMRVLGFAQRFGVGIPIARRALRANGQEEPEFHVDPTWVSCTVRAGG